MDIILLQRVEKLGQMGDVVSVKPGFARNFLLPTGRAVRATAAKLAEFKEKRKELEAHNLTLKKEAEAVASKMDGLSVVIIRQAGENGLLYGSIRSKDIAEALDAAGYKIARTQVALVEPLKTLGIQSVKVVLHPEVSVMVAINVAQSEEEAKMQASGETKKDQDA